MVDKPKMIDRLMTAAMLTLAISFFLGVSSRSKSQISLESSLTAEQPVQVVSLNQ